VRFSKYFTAPMLAVAQTDPELILRKSLSPAASRPNIGGLVLVNRDSTFFRPERIASRYGFFRITR
jgi:hypothetical protein